MSDFTKEELIDIRACIDAAGISEMIPLGIIKPLRVKIQSMIDNYGEHELTEYKEDVPSIPHCKKCNQIIFGNFPCPCSLMVR